MRGAWPPVAMTRARGAQIPNRIERVQCRTDQPFSTMRSRKGRSEEAGVEAVLLAEGVLGDAVEVRQVSIDAGDFGFDHATRKVGQFGVVLMKPFPSGLGGAEVMEAGEVLFHERGKRLVSRRWRSFFRARFQWR